MRRCHIYPRISTCLDAFAYLREICERIAAHRENRLEELLPDSRVAARSGVADD
jgi:hypothetical protein